VDAANVEKAREHIQSLGLYGKVSVRQWDRDTLPYIDNLVNLIVVERPGKVPTTEILRVLAPNGVACLKQDGNWTKTVKPWPEEIDHWTHSQYDASGNAVNRDKLVGPPRRLQWVGGPKWTRHHEFMSSFHAMVSASGRVFYILDEGPQVSLFLPPDWKLIARDAFNGKVLWKQPLGPWVSTMRSYKSGPAFVARLLVASDNRVFTTLNIRGPLSVLDASNGSVIKTYPETKGTEEIICSNDTLFMVVNRDPKPLNQRVEPDRGRGDKGYYGAWAGEKKWIYGKPGRQDVVSDGTAGDAKRDHGRGKPTLGRQARRAPVGLVHG
jgi:outer membrane protein assembly factor BamB